MLYDARKKAQQLATWAVMLSKSLDYLEDVLYLVPPEEWGDWHIDVQMGAQGPYFLVSGSHANIVKMCLEGHGVPVEVVD
jgi:hypothetical protein